jgi:hypothetical protein
MYSGKGRKDLGSPDSFEAQERDASLNTSMGAYTPMYLY